MRVAFRFRWFSFPNVILSAAKNLDDVGHTLGQRRCYAFEILRCAQNDIGGKGAQNDIRGEGY